MIFSFMKIPHCEIILFVLKRYFLNHILCRVTSFYLAVTLEKPGDLVI